MTHSFRELESLVESLGSDVCLRTVDGNLGDAVIHSGERHLLDRLGVKVTTETTSPAQPVLLSLPGFLVAPNYGNGGRALQAFLSLPNPLVVLPSTVRGFGAILRSLPYLSAVFARERATFQHLKRLDMGSKLGFCHDLAFELGESEKVERALDVASPSGVLLALRADSEAAHRGDHGAHGVFDVSGQRIDRWADPDETERWVNAMFDFVASFDVIVTDRLHVAIVSSLLGRECWLLAGSYWKNEEVWKASMREYFPSTHFAPDLSSVPSEVVQRAATDARERWTERTVELSTQAAPSRLRLAPAALSKRLKMVATVLRNDPAGLAGLLGSAAANDRVGRLAAIELRRVERTTRSSLGHLPAVLLEEKGIRFGVSWEELWRGGDLIPHSRLTQTRFVIVDPSIGSPASEALEMAFRALAEGGVMAVPGYRTSEEHVLAVDRLLEQQPDLRMTAGSTVWLERR